MSTVLFACVHNAGRSQMAAAFFNQHADPTRARAFSAGTQPGTTVHPEVLVIMRERGIDLAGTAPRLLTADLAAEVHWLITMGCGDACPVVPGVRREDWPFEDPKGRPLDEVRAIRASIEARVVAFVRGNGWGKKATPAGA